MVEDNIKVMCAAKNQKDFLEGSGVPALIDFCDKTNHEIQSVKDIKPILKETVIPLEKFVTEFNESKGEAEQIAIPSFLLGDLRFGSKKLIESISDYLSFEKETKKVCAFSLCTRVGSFSYSL